MNRIVLVMIYGHSRIIPDDSRSKEVERECPQMVRELSPLIFMVIHGRFLVNLPQSTRNLLHTKGKCVQNRRFGKILFQN